MVASNIVEGTIPFTVSGQIYLTWYKIYGSLTSRPPPLIVLHGGPGASHDYMLPIADISHSGDSIPVIFYDQLGTANSKHPDLLKKDSSFWTIDLFISELENLLSYFEISQSYDVLGHSWGVTLAAEFIVRRRPKGLRRLILSNSLASTKLRNDSVARLRKTLPADMQEAFRKDEEAITTGSQEYKDTSRLFFENFGCRLKPPPPELTFSLSQAEREGGRGNGMAKDWTIIDGIHQIGVSTLLINGKYDFMSDDVCLPFFVSLPKVKWIQFANSSHVPQWEERDRNIRLRRIKIVKNRRITTFDSFLPPESAEFLKIISSGTYLRHENICLTQDINTTSNSLCRC